MAIMVGNEYGTSSLCTDLETHTFFFFCLNAHAWTHTHRHTLKLGKYGTVISLKFNTLLLGVDVLITEWTIYVCPLVVIMCNRIKKKYIRFYYESFIFLLPLLNCAFVLSGFTEHLIRSYYIQFLISWCAVHCIPRSVYRVTSVCLHQ